MSNLPIQFTDKVNSPELLAIMQQFGEHTYVDAELINKFRDAINELHNSLNPDRIISLGSETIVGNEYTYEGYTWQLGGVQINNIGNPIQIVLPSATTGFKRNDISVFKANGTIERIAGIETDDEVVATPEVPPGSILLKIYNVVGDQITIDPTPIIVGNEFVEKTDFNPYNSNVTGTDAIIPLDPNGYSEIRLTNTGLISIAGYDLSLILGNANAKSPYPGKPFIILNLTGHDVVIKKELPTADYPFYFSEENDLVFPKNHCIYASFDPSGFRVIFKSWIDVDLSTKADLVGGKVPASQLPSYVDDVLEFTDLASFPATGESGKIYVALDTNYTYRWSGSAYVKISDNEKLDKSSTPSSVYTTNSEGLQVMKPISEFQPVGDYVTVNTTQTVTGNKTFNDVGLIKKVPTEVHPNQSGGSFAIGGDGGYDIFEFYSLDGTDQNSFGSVQIYSNPKEGNFIYHISLDNKDASYLIVNYFDLSLINLYAGQRTALYVDGKNKKIKIEGSQSKYAALGTSLITGTKNFEFPNQSGTLALLSDLSEFTTPSEVATQITTAINSNKTSFTHNILVSNWTLVSGKYEAVISNAGILSNSFVDVIPSNDHVDIVRNAQIYPSVLISEGSVKVYSKFLPSDTISVTVNIN